MVLAPSVEFRRSALIGLILCVTVPSAFAEGGYAAFNECVEVNSRRQLAELKQEPVLRQIETEAEALFAGAIAADADAGLVLSVRMEDWFTRLREFEREGRSASDADRLRAEAGLRKVELDSQAKFGAETSRRLMVLARRQSVARDFEEAAKEFRQVSQSSLNSPRRARESEVTTHLLDATEELFKSEGVTYLRNHLASGYEVLRILPTLSEAHPARINRIALRVYQRFHGLTLTFCPEELLKAEALGLLSWRENRINIGLGSVERLGLDPTGAHEVNHGYHFNLRARGLESPFNYTLEATDQAHLLSDDEHGYNLYMHGSELPAHSLSLVFMALKLRSMPLSSLLGKPGSELLERVESYGRRAASLARLSRVHAESARARLTRLAESQESSLVGQVSWVIERKPSEVDRLDFTLQLDSGVQLKVDLVRRDVVNQAKKVEVFGGRLMNGDDTARSPLFAERKILFGLVRERLNELHTRASALETQYTRVEASAKALLSSHLRGTLESDFLNRDALVDSILRARGGVQTANEEANPRQPDSVALEPRGFGAFFRDFWRRVSGQAR